MTHRPAAAGALALVCVLLAAAPAPAAPRTKAAQAFSDAGLHGLVALKRQGPEIARQIEALQPELCSEVLEDVVEAKRSLRRALPFMLMGLFTPLYDAIGTASRQVVAELDAVTTRDAALIAGRDAWREGASFFDRIPRIERPCERLREWRDSGWREDLRPPLLEDEMEALEAPSERVERGLARAERRLRQLGVSRKAARRFTAESWGDAIELPDELFGASTGTDRVVGPQPLRR